MRSNFRLTKGISPNIVEELAVKLHSAGIGSSEFDSVVAREISATVEFTYSPGTPERGADGPMEDAEEAVPAELNITAVKTVLPTYFENENCIVLSVPAGYDLLSLMVPVEVEAMGEQLLARAKKGDF